MRARDVLSKSVLAGAATLALLAPLHAAEGGTFKVLYAFGATNTDGAFPIAGLIIDSAGNLYGTTSAGGAYGVGTVFEIAAGGSETLLHSFNGYDGASPWGGVDRDRKGNLWGTTQYGGHLQDCRGSQNPSGCGVVFELATNGTLRVVHAFTSGNDGAIPYAGINNDIGTTSEGGETELGTVFRITRNGKETILHTFDGYDGGGPQANVITDSAGNIYGTTASGGSGCCGTVFKITPGGSESVLYSFTGGNDGKWPLGSLKMDKAGNLYGTTWFGGANGLGTLFKVAPDGSETVLHSFGAYAKDGSHPTAGLIGNDKGTILYGTTGGTGADGRGTVFEYKNGKEKILYHFTGGNDGCYPGDTLVSDKTGNLYGTTEDCGQYGGGVVFELSLK